ncbi:HAMP domain-containing histidine kinase [Methanoculleus sp. Wushi-C6]|uniref:histidine kinase n=1 Tax=Methanoculleus caldifontis TaxID=2651577 RepID=A0ABU3WYN8_9EURY|nr:HAMP domain-containing sensor histidine kinase [Methanoculleus sp. Wushi-C6]MDV2480914.1 HAMP domain-containing histidine kinase [Methanoculleus sp. Wushi-C6]
MAAKRAARPSLPFMVYLLLAIVLAMGPVVCLISCIDYIGVQQGLEANAEEFREQTEYGAILSLSLVDAGLKLFDGTLDREMEEAFGPVLAEYERTGGDPARMDLLRVKEALGGGMDVYIINESGVIEYTTYLPDLGCDFREYPSFYDRITEIRLGETFAADRVVAGIATGEFRKYAYLPSPDHRYLFELGLAESEFRRYRTTLKYGDAVRDLVNLNPGIREIRIFDCMGTRVTGKAHPDDDHRLLLVRQAYREKTTLEEVNATAGELTRYLFVDLSDSDYASDMSMIVELTYSTKAADEKIADLFARQVGVLLVGFVLISCLSAFAVHVLARPVRNLVEDVDAVARGDLSHPIRVDGSEEFVRLGESVSAMVGALKETMQKLRASEEEIIRRSHTLEEEVRERTADLEESNRMATLFLDIMRHDINNANNVANLYSDLLLTEIEGQPEAELLRKAKIGLAKSIEIVRNVNTIQHIQGGLLSPSPVDLDLVIRREIEQSPGARIAYTGSTAVVLADDLLSEVFANLIGNAVKFGGPEIGIAIRVEEHGEEVVISVEDDGPGIPDAVKPRLFDRLSRGTHRAAGTGLGLYICRMLVERYGGRIWAEDRVEGRPECGAAIRFTLRKAGAGGGR